MLVKSKVLDACRIWKKITAVYFFSVETFRLVLS